MIFQALCIFELREATIHLAIEHKDVFALFMLVHVVLHVAAAHKLLLAEEALEWFFYRVCSLVPFEITFLGKLGVTLSTLKLFLDVDGLVCFERRGSFEGLGALQAFEWPILGSMKCYHMSIEQIFVLKQGLAAFLVTTKKHYIFYYNKNNY